MTSEQRRKLEEQLKDNGAKQSSYDSNKWNNGNNSFTFKGDNRLNTVGSTTYGYEHSRDRIDKKGK